MHICTRAFSPRGSMILCASVRTSMETYMTRPEVTGRKTGAAIDGDAYSIAEFCHRHRISVQAFYKFREEMPLTFRVGTRVLISKEAAAAWRRERERAAQAAERVA
jgi:hypothetical protein